MNNAIYAGSFDPFTYGHLDIIKRASKIFDNVYVVIANNSYKTRFLSEEKSFRAIEEVLANKSLDNCHVLLTSGLVADLAKDLNIKYLIRGLRNSIDFEYEDNIRNVNKVIDPDLETIYLPSNNRVISSSMVRELYKHGKDISEFIPYPIHKLIKEL